MLAAVESELWSVLLGLGRAVIMPFLLRQAARPRAATYEYEGMRYALDQGTHRKSEIGTHFGKVSFQRPIGRTIGERRHTDLPIDRELGVCSGFSLCTVTAMSASSEKRENLSRPK